MVDADMAGGRDLQEDVVFGRRTRLVVPLHERLAVSARWAMLVSRHQCRGRGPRQAEVGKGG